MVSSARLGFIWWTWWCDDGDDGGEDGEDEGSGGKEEGEEEGEGEERGGERAEELPVQLLFIPIMLCLSVNLTLIIFLHINNCETTEYSERISIWSSMPNQEFSPGYRPVVLFILLRPRHLAGKTRIRGCSFLMTSAAVFCPGSLCPFPTEKLGLMFLVVYSKVNIQNLVTTLPFLSLSLIISRQSTF